MKSIVILTSNSLRHDYLRIMFGLNPEINVLRSYIEVPKNIETQPDLSEIEKNHFLTRSKTEIDFFSDIVSSSKDSSNPVSIEKNNINDQSYINEVKKLNPDLIITFGCCIIRENFLEAFKNKIINVHLGISPYYLGAGTNFISMVNNDLQCTGYTFMYMDQGIDTGEIIHQARAEVCLFDNMHQIGNRLIKNMVHDFVKLVSNFHLIKKIHPVASNINPIICFNRDATKLKTIELYNNFLNGSVKNFLANKEELESRYPIIEQNFLK
jgi:phosphoribosylglycinamide formyltransferase 1